MKIGIVGAGNIGTNLAKRFHELGHEVEIANSRGPQTLTEIAREAGAVPVDVRGLAKGKDLIVVAIPMRSVPELPSDLLNEAPAAAVVVDTTNYVLQQRDGRIEELEDGMLESRWVSRHLGRPVVKAFNNMGAEHLVSKARPQGDADRVSLPVSGDDPEAKSVVLKLIDDMGFEPADVGTLEDSWRHQPGSLVYGTDLPIGELRTALAATPRERPAKYSAAR